MIKYNYYLDTRVQIWLVCRSKNDFEFEQIQVKDSVGAPFYTEDGHLDWFTYETKEGEGIDGLLDTIALDLPERLAWLAQHGIAPSQPFQVEIQAPRYYTHRHTGEGDVDYGDWRVVQIEPWSNTRITRAWKGQSEFIIDIEDAG